MDELCARVLADHPEVSKIDLDIGRRAQVLAPCARADWGFWLRHHCRWLWGEDLARRLPSWRPAPVIARAVNAGFAEQLERLAAAIAAADEPRVRRPLQREAARRLIRATHILREDGEAGWAWSLDEHVLRTGRQYPERWADLRFLLGQSQRPDASRAAFLASLRRTLAWLVQQAR